MKTETRVCLYSKKGKPTIIRILITDRYVRKDTMFNNKEESKMYYIYNSFTYLFSCIIVYFYNESVDKKTDTKG